MKLRDLHPASLRVFASVSATERQTLAWDDTRASAATARRPLHLLAEAGVFKSDSCFDLTMRASADALLIRLPLVRSGRLAGAS